MMVVVAVVVSVLKRELAKDNDVFGSGQVTAACFFLSAVLFICGLFCGACCGDSIWVIFK